MSQAFLLVLISMNFLKIRALPFVCAAVQKGEKH